jgi:hypothetical protein
LRGRVHVSSCAGLKYLELKAKSRCEFTAAFSSRKN